MSITTNAELKTAVANWLERSDLTSRIPEFISMAEDRIYNDPELRRIRALEDAADLTLVSGTRTVALPSGFIGVRRLYLDTDPIRRLEYLSPDNYWIRYASTEQGKPELYTIEGDNIVFGPIPDQGYTGKLLMRKRLAALSADGDTNWFLSNARGLLLYGALLEAAPFLEDDPRALTWAALWDDLKEKVVNGDLVDRYPAGSPIARPDMSIL